MKTELIAENYERFFGEKLNEADMVSQQGQDMSGGPIQQNDPAAEPVDTAKPDTEMPDEEGDENDAKPADTEELSKQIFELLKEGEVPESLIIKFFGKDDKSEDEVKKALEDLKSEGKVQDRVIWSIVATDEEEDKTGVSKSSTEDETDLETEEEPTPEVPAQPAGTGGAPAPTAPAPSPMGGGQPPMAMKADKRNYVGNDEDEDFKDDEFDDFDDEDELPQEGLPDDKESDEEHEEEEGKYVDEIIDDVDDIRTLLKSIEPRLRRLREKSASAKKVVK